MTIAIDDRYSCARCGAEFTSPDELRHHSRETHDVVSGSLPAFLRAA